MNLRIIGAVVGAAAALASAPDAAALPAAAVDRVIAEVESLEQAPDVRALVEPMRAAKE